MSKLDLQALEIYRQNKAADLRAANPLPPQGALADFVDNTQAGLYQGAAGAGEFLGLDSVRDWGEQGAAEQLQTISPVGQASMQKTFFNEDNPGVITLGDAWTDPRAIANQFGHTLGLNADILLGGGAIKAGKLAVTSVAKEARKRVLAQTGKAELADEAAAAATQSFMKKQFGDKAEMIGGYAGDTLAYGAAGHAVSSGVAALDIGQEVEAMDFEELVNSPEFVNLVKQNKQMYPAMPADQLLAQSRSELAEISRTAVKTNPALLTSNLLVGGLGTAALTRIFSGAMPKGAGIGAEFATEAAQGGIEQYAKNQVVQENIDPTQALDEGMTAAALNEGVMGAGMGIATAGAGALYNKGKAMLPSKAAPVTQPGAAGTAQSASVLPDIQDSSDIYEPVDPAQDAMGAFIKTATEASKQYPHVVDVVGEIAFAEPEKLKSAVAILDNFMASPDFANRTIQRMAEYMRNPGTDQPDDLQKQDMQALIGVIGRQNEDMAQQLSSYVEANPGKTTLALSVASRYLTDPSFRPKAEEQLASHLKKTGEEKAMAEAVDTAEAQIDSRTDEDAEEYQNPALFQDYGQADSEAGLAQAADDADAADFDAALTAARKAKQGPIQLADPRIEPAQAGWNDAGLSTALLTDPVDNTEKSVEIKASVDNAAAQAALSKQNDLPEPTPAQKEAGNYKKGHTKLHGLDIAIENPAGSVRSGTNAKGESWSVDMQDHYGYIKRTEGADGDHVDVFIGKNPASQKVFIVDQYNGDGSFDEHKVVLGADNMNDAIDTYARNYSPGWNVGPVAEMSVDDFKGWLKNGDTKAPVTNFDDESTPLLADFGALQIEQYSEKSIVVRGETKAYADALKNLKGTYNPRLKGGAGWIYGKGRLDELKRALPGIIQRDDRKQENAQLSKAGESEKGDLFTAAYQRQVALASRARVHDAALAQRIETVLPPERDAGFDAGRVQAELDKYEKQVALNEKREAIKKPQGVNQAGSKSPAPKTGDAIADYWANSASESVKNTPPVHVNIDDKAPAQASDEDAGRDERVRQLTRLKEGMNALAERAEKAGDHQLGAYLREAFATVKPKDSDVMFRNIDKFQVDDILRTRAVKVSTAEKKAANATEKSVMSTWNGSTFAQRREQLRAVGYTDADQGRVLSGADWTHLPDRVRDALSGKKEDKKQALLQQMADRVESEENTDDLVTLTSEEAIALAKDLSDGQYDPVLSRISKHKAVKDLKIFFRGANGGPSRLGVYSVDGHCIMMNARVFRHALDGKTVKTGEAVTANTVSELITHELIHAVTHKAVTDNREFAEKLSEIRKTIKGWLDKNQGTISDKALLNHLRAMAGSIQELATYSLTNAKVQETLKQIPSQLPKQSLFSEFVAAVRRLLGIADSDNNLLADIIGLTDNLMSAEDAAAMRQKKGQEFTTPYGVKVKIEHDITDETKTVAMVRELRTGKKIRNVVDRKDFYDFVAGLINEAQLQQKYNAFDASTEKNEQQPSAPGEAKALDNATAPEHVTYGVDDRELAEIVAEFNQAMDERHGEDNEVTNVFVAPKPAEVVRLEQKVKVYHKEHGWMTPAEARAKINEWKEHANSQYKDDKTRSANSDKVVLSLFDKSGKWSEPWERAGYQVYRFDIQNDDIIDNVNLGDVNNFGTGFFGEWFEDFDGKDIYAILAACPCTDFAASGARHFAAKDQDGRTIASVKLVHQTLRTIEYFKPAVWALENPVGRIEKLGGLPPWRLAFDPNHMGETYTKKTLIWGRFNGDLPIAPVDPVEGSKMHSKYGGKSLATKNARSVTPEGFAYSFFMANNAADHPVMAFANKFDRLDRDLIAEAFAAGVTERELEDAIEDFYYMDLDDDAANDAIRELIAEAKGDNAPAPTKAKEKTSLFSDVSASNDRAAKLLQAKSDGFDTDKIWHRGSLFNASKYGDSNDDSFFGKGFYLTSDPLEAEDYASTDVTRNMDYTVNAEKLAKAKGITYNEAKAELSKGEKTVAEFVVKAPALLTIGDKGLVFKGRPIGLGAVDIEGILGRAGVSDEDIERFRTQWERIGNNDRKLLDNLVGKDGAQGRGYIELLRGRKALPAMREIALELGADAILMKDGTAPTKQTRKGAEHLVVLKPQAVMNISNKPFNDDPATHPKLPQGEIRPRSDGAPAVKQENEEALDSKDDVLADIESLYAAASAVGDWEAEKELTKIKGQIDDLSELSVAEKLDAIESSIRISQPLKDRKPLKQRYVSLMNKQSVSASQIKGANTSAEADLSPPSSIGGEKSTSKLDAVSKVISDKKLEKAEKLAALLKSRKGQLNSGIDPEIMIAVAEVGALSIAEGAVKFAQWVRDVMATTRAVGIADDDVKPFLKEAYGAIAANPEKYGVSDAVADDMDSAKDIRKQDIESLIDDAGAAVEDVRDSKELDDEALQKVLLAGFEGKRQSVVLNDIKDNRMLREAVGEMLGIPTKDVSNIQLKAGQEAYEVVSMKNRRMHLRTMFSRYSAKETCKTAALLYMNQPNLNMRSANSADMQAYSTPAPMAFIANVAAGVNTKTRVYEPTAGNGLLMMLNHPKNTFANELDPIRAKALAWSGFNVTVADGSMNPISSGLVDGPVDVVLANPPFGKLRDSNGKPTKYTFTDYRGKEHIFGELDHVIAAESLSAMKDDGKAVLILGAAKETGEYRGNNKAFLNWLYSNYNVVHHVEADGSLYQRQGAAWPTQMIVIYGRERNGTGKFAPLAEEIKRYEKWSALYDSFDQAGLMGAKSDGNTDTFGDGRVLSTRYATAERGISPRPDFERVSDRDPANDASGQKKPGTTGRSAGVDGSGRDSKPSAGTFNSQPDLIESGLVEAKAAPAAESGSAGYTRGAERVGLSGKRNVELKPIVRVNAFQAEYPTQSQGKNDHVLTPINIASYTQKALAELSAKHPGGVDGYVQEKLGYKNSDELHDAFLGLQVDAVALGIHAIESGRAIIIGDQTGIGKGRQAAAVIRYAMQQGKVPVFVTQKVNLFTDMYDDLHDIGVAGVRPLVMNADKGITKDEQVLFKLSTKERQAALRSLAANRTMPDGFDYLSMTYSQIAGDRTGEKIALLKQIADNAIFVLDEAHTAAGQESKLGVVFQELVGNAAGVTYLSATYAKRPDNMLLYTRTDLGLAMDTFDELVSVVDRGGIGMMTYIAGKLAQAGQMIRRERSFDGININNVFLKDTGGKIKKQFDAATEALRAVQDLSSAWKGYVQTVIAKEKQREGGFDTSVAGNQADSTINVTLFSSVVHNYISQLTLAIKAKHIADVAIAQHNAGERPVIALDNTMGSALEDYMELARLSVGDRAEGFDFAELLTTMADRVLAYSIKEPGQDKGTKVYVPISQIKDSHLKNLYKKVKKSAQALKKYDIAASPIDVIRSEIERAGLSVAEVTGRTLMIDYNDNAVIKQKEAQEKKDRRRTVDAFNSGALNVLILNQAGSTGLSIHAKESYKDRKPRHMIVAQASLDINTFMQMLGRVNRTGQVVKPSYSVAWLPLPSEKRPAAVLSGKMRKLNANTSGNDKSATSIESVDLLNPYGNAMVNQYVAENRAELATYNEKLIDLPDGDEAVYFLGKLAVCPVDVQERVYAEVEALYRQYVAYLDATGQNELSTDFVDLDAKPIAQKLISEDKPGRGVFSEPAYLTQVDVKTSGKAPSWQEVEQELSKTSQADFDAVVQAIEADTAYYNALRSKYDEVFKAREAADEKGEDTKNLLAELVHLTGKVQAAESERTNLKYEMSSGAMYSHGSRIRVKMDGYEHPVLGVIVGVDYGHKPGVGNPAAPSKISFKVMLADRSRTIPLSLSQARNGIVEGVARDSDAAIAAIFNHVSKMPQREERYIMTGNLLAAQHLSISKGRIIPFTTQDGRVIQGLLMPLSFTPETGIREDYHATIEDLLAWFKQADPELAGVGLTTSSKDATIYREERTGRYVVQLPRSASKGKPFWGNPDVERVIGRQAFSGGGTVLIKVAPEKLDDLVKAINRIEPLRVNAEGQVKDLKRFMGVAANEFSKDGIVFSKENRIGAKPAKGVPAQIVEREAAKILKKLQGAAGIRVKVLKTQAEAEAIWQMKLDGDAVRGAYSKNTRTAYVIAENVRNMRDLQQTLAHEIIAHGGLDTVIGEQSYQEFIEKIQKTRTSPHFKTIWAQIDKDYKKASEREKAEEVFAYYVQYQPVEPALKLWWTALLRWLAKKLQAVGILPAGNESVEMMDDMIQSIRTGFAVGRASKAVKDALSFQMTGASRLNMHFKDVVKRVPELQAAAKKLQQGDMSAAEYDQLVNEYKPVAAYRDIPSLATTSEMQKALDSNKVGKIGVPFNELADGDFVGLRLDIPAYSNHGVWIVSVHEGKKGGKGGSAGKVIGYDSAAMVKNPNMGMAEKSTLQIAAGAAKGTIATIGGAWVSKSPAEIAAYAQQVLNSRDWVQVGMDPERHSYFYDRATMEPVVSGEEAIQIGGLVLVKKPVYGSKGDFLFKKSIDGKSPGADTPEFKRWFGDSKIVNADGSPKVVYHGSPSGDINVFQSAVELDFSGDNVRPYDTAGLYFSPNKDLANAFARNFDRGGNGTVYPVYLSMENPLVVGDGEVLTAGVKGALNRLMMGGKKFAAEKRLNDFRNGASRTAGISAADIKTLKDAGYDGVINEDDFEYIVFEPTQIKSAIGNNGDFDSDNPDIRFSKSDVEQTGNPIMDAVSKLNAERLQRWARLFNPSKITAAMKAKWPDIRPAMLQMLPRNYLADIGGHLLPSLRRYNAQVAQMEAQRNELLGVAHETADKWRKLVGKQPGPSAKLADLMHEATLMGVDPSDPKFVPAITRQTYNILMSRAKAFIKSRNGEAVAVARGMERRRRIQEAMDRVPTQERAYANMRKEFLALPPEHQALFIEVRDSYIKMNQERVTALEKRIEDLIADKRVAAAQISLMREEFEVNGLSGIYFPLQRFGKYRAVVKGDEDGQVLAFSMFETNAQMQQWITEQQAPGVTVQGGYQFEYSKMVDGVSAGFMKDLLQKFGSVFSKDNKIQDDLYQLFLSHSPDLSMRKHMIHRKGVEGFSEDALRAFAHNQFHSAYQIAKVSHTHHMQSHILALEDEARIISNTDDRVRATQVVNELQQRNEWILSPKGSEWANKLTGFGFFWYLGTTPAAALVNITQTAMVGLPVIGARYGFKETAKVMGQMSKAFIKGKGNVDNTLTGRELGAFRELEKSGIIDKTMAHDMTGIAEGGVSYSPRYHKVMKVAGWMFHHAERFNREVTAMAAYRLAFDKFKAKHSEGLAHNLAIAEAIEMTRLSHFDYANSNRPRFMQGDVARVVLLFRQHSINMTYRLIRDFQQSFWGKGQDKKIAQRQLAGMLGMTLFFAGAAGLPLYSVIAGVFNTMLDDEDDPFDFDDAVREALADAIGDTAASAIMSGVPGTAVDVDLTNRVGMNNLWFRDPEADVEGEAAVQYYAEQALGPMYGILAGWGKAATLAREGHTGRAWEAAVPKFARDMFKSVRYADEGVLTKRGDPIIDDVSPWQIALSANGFTPLELSDQYRSNNVLSGAQRRLRDRRQQLLNRYALARRLGDDMAVNEALTVIEKFNIQQPTLKISAADRVKSLKQRQRLSDRAVNGVIVDKKLSHLTQ